MSTPDRKLPVLVLACLALCAGWIALSRIHVYQNSDTLLMVLISLQRWTPLFWEQDRLGMLFPLLAWPWRHPFDNVLVQCWLTTFFCLASSFLLGNYVLGRQRGVIVGALSCVLLIGCLDLYQRFTFLINVHHFATSAAFGLAGLILLDHWHERSRAAKTAGILSLLVGHWINPSLAIALGPLLLVRGLCFRALSESESADRYDSTKLQTAIRLPSFVPSFASRGFFAACRVLRLGVDEVRALTVISGCLAFAMIVSRTAPNRQSYRFLRPAEWYACAREMAELLWQEYAATWLAACVAIAAVGMLSWCWRDGRAAARVSLPVFLGLFGTAAAQFLFMTALNHIRDCQSSRHMLLAVFIAQAAPVSFAVVQLAATFGHARFWRGVPVAALLALVLTVAWTHGRPGIDVARASLDEAAGAYTEDVLSAQCTHITGDYWNVWKAVFHANMRLADEHSPRHVWGLCFRSGPTRPQWQHLPPEQLRIAEILGDEQRSHDYREKYGLANVAASALHGKVRVLTPSAPHVASDQVAIQPSTGSR